MPVQMARTACLTLLLGLWMQSAGAQSYYIKLGPPVVRLGSVAAPVLPLTPNVPRRKPLQDAFAAGRYKDAVGIAQKLLAQAQTQYGKGSIGTEPAWVDLGACQYNAGDSSAAARSYAQAVRLLDTAQSNRDPRLALPLYGLGAAQYIQGDYAAAARNIQRSIFVTRVHDGLNSISQLQYYPALTETYLALGNYDAAEKRQKARVAIIARATGKNSPESVGALQQAAQLTHRVHRYFDERGFLGRQLRLMEKAKGVDAVALVPILLKLGATYRLDYDPQDIAVGDLQRAVNILQAHPELPDDGQLADAWVELGDLYLTFGRSSRAYHYYETAYKLLAKAGNSGKIQALFSKPVPVFVPRPESLAGVGDTPAAGLPVGYALMQFNLSQRGRPQDIKTLEIQPPASAQSVRSRAHRAMRLSRFRLPMNAQGPVKQKDVKYKLLFNYVEQGG